MLLSWLLLAMSAAVASAANILMVVPVPSKSHVLLFERLVLELASRGHTITYISAHTLPKGHANITQAALPVVLQTPDGKPMDFLKLRNQSSLSALLNFPEIGLACSEQMLSNPDFWKPIKAQKKFDLLLQEAFVSEGMMAGLARQLNVPFIGYATFIPSAWTNYMVGNIAPSALLPEPFTGNPYPMNFWQRLGNFLYVLVSDLNHHLFYLPRQDALMRKYFGNDHPYVTDIIQNMSVLLINDHVSTSFPRPSVPNMIGIGGLHLADTKPLPKDLQTYLDNSKKGAILFSLGSNIKASLMSKEKVKIFIDTFSKLEQNVLWKFEEDIHDVPKNVLISKWLPQADILAHPNLKLFITHGGLLSTTEAIAHGVPVVGIPIFGDQPTNMAMAVNNGIGVSLLFDEVTPDRLLAAVQEVLTNPSYTDAVKQRSQVYHDRILSPMQLAIWWIEYVLRHKDNARHLRSASQDQAWYQAQQLDVVALLFLALLIPIYILKKILCRIWQIISPSSSKKSTGISKKRN